MRVLTASKDGYQNITHLILDEVHEHELNTDLLLIAVKEAIAVEPSLKVILMSATINAEEFSAYFGDCPMINVPGRLFDVNILHLEDVLVDTWWFPPGFSSSQCNGLSNEQLLTEYLKTVDTKTDHILIGHVIDHIHATFPRNESILVFLPGYKEIMDQSNLLNDMFVRSGIRNFKIFVLHSFVDHGDLFNARHEEGVRKIILSTNIAEISITIDDVVCCVFFLKFSTTL